MKVLITGATGYVGKHLIEELSNQKYEIFALVRSTSQVEHLKRNRINLIYGDISYKASLDNISAQFNIIIHLAFSLFPESNPLVNETGFDNILSFAQHQKQSLQKFIFISSQLVYGNTPSDKLIDETQACNANMYFAKQQIRAENKLINLHKTSNFPFVIIRPSEIYGGKGGFFKTAQLDGYINGSTPIVGSGNNALSFTYVGDLVQAIVSTIDKPGVIGEIFNINTCGTLSLNDLVKVIRSHVKTKSIFRVPVFMGWIVASMAMLIAGIRGKTPFMDYDIIRVATMESGARTCKKAVHLLNFKPKYKSVAEGLENCYFK